MVAHGAMSTTVRSSHLVTTITREPGPPSRVAQRQEFFASACSDYRILGIGNACQEVHWKMILLLS
jgi:hypothetical protein